MPILARTRRMAVIRRGNRGQSEELTVVVAVADPVILTGKEGDRPESIFRRSIERLTGIQKNVLTDVYRYLVLSNYVGLNGRRGKAAAEALDANYPGQHTLPMLDQKSGRFNASGAILSTLLDRGSLPEEEFVDAFSVVGSILVALVEGHFLPKPILDTRLPIKRALRAKASVSQLGATTKNQTNEPAKGNAEVARDASGNWSAHIAVVCAALREGDIEFARQELVSRCPSMPLPKSPRGARLNLDPSSPRPVGEATKRQFSKSQAVRVFVRDGFCDRYTGDRLIFPGVLRVLSELFPLEFQWHPNWKIGACHNLYWLLQATVDHIVPVTYQGADDDANWVSTSMLRNIWKSNASLEQLGWSLLPIDALPRWDGLMNWFIWYCGASAQVRSKPYIRQWLGPARKAMG